MKLCKKCGNSFPLRITIDGKERLLQRRNFCLDCSPFGKHNTLNLSKSKAKGTDRAKYYRYQKKERARRKQLLVAMLGGVCKYCPYNKCYKAMEFDHRDPSTKKFSLSGNMMRKWEVVVAEAMKCDLVCANCHRERHNET